MKFVDTNHSSPILPLSSHNIPSPSTNIFTGTDFGKIMREVSSLLVLILISACVISVLCAPENEQNHHVDSQHGNSDRPLAHFSPRVDHPDSQVASTSTSHPPVGPHEGENDHRRGARSMSIVSHHADLPVLHDGHPIELERKERSDSHHNEQQAENHQTSPTLAGKARSDSHAEQETHHSKDVHAKNDHATTSMRGEERHKRHFHVDLGGYGYHGLPIFGYHGFHHDHHGHHYEDYHHHHHH